MGNYTSKLFPNHNESEAKARTRANETSPCSSPKTRLCTPPVTKRKLQCDPRSATVEITRTPIEVTRTPLEHNRQVASALPKYLQGKRYLETDFDATMPVTTPVKCITDPRSPNVSQQRTPIMVKSVANYFSPVVTVNQAPEMDTPLGIRAIVSALDPRSPAIDFDRTPILKPKSIEHSAASSEDKSVPSTENKTGNAILSYCETTTDYNVPEIQTILQTVSPIDEQNSQNNVSGALKELKSSGTSSEETSDCSENEEQITVIRNPKVLSSYPDPISTWTENESFETDDNAAGKFEQAEESLGKTLDNDISEMINAVMKNTIDEQITVVNNEKIKVWRDSTSPIINDEIKNAAQINSVEEIVIEFDDEAITKNSKINAAKVTSKYDDDKSKNQAKKKRSQQQIKSENKPFIEEKKVFHCEGKNTIDPSLNRTPLGNRSNNHKPQLRLSAKSPQQLLRNKGLSARTIQQENTPPTERFISKTKPPGIQWDPDTTVII